MPDWIDDSILLCAWYPVPDSADYPTIGTAAASDGRSPTPRLAPRGARDRLTSHRKSAVSAPDTARAHRRP